MKVKVITLRATRPDFAARLKAIYGKKVMKVSGVALLMQERKRF